jgi:ribosomal protein S4E
MVPEEGAHLTGIVRAQEEASYKLLKVTKQKFGKGGIPYIATHDGRTIRYPDPDIKVGTSSPRVRPFSVF